MKANKSDLSHQLNFTTTLLTCFFFLAGCLGDKDSGISTLQPGASEATKARIAIASHNLTGDPSRGRNLPDIDSPKAQLGMKLFFTKALGGDMNSACVTCHHPVLGGGDDLSLSVGVDGNFDDLLGPGRLHNTSGEHFDGGPTVPRNAPTTFNIAMYDKSIFHDGRIESLGGTAGAAGNDGHGIRTPDSLFGIADPDAGIDLAAAQARFPVTSPEEMRDFYNFKGLSNAKIREYIEQRIGHYGDPMGGALPLNLWLQEFRDGFQEPFADAKELITFNNIAEALAEYERSQVLTDTPWKAFVEGDDQAINTDAQVGAQLFFNSIESGGANCVSCHSGDFFTDEKFHVIAMPQIGRGKGDGTMKNDDFGRFRETGKQADMYAFRTPALLNTTATGPWGHAGSYTTLEAVIRHHLNPQEALDNYDFNQLSSDIQTEYLVDNTQKAINVLEANRLAGLPTIQKMSLSDNQIAQLIEFLNTLTDPCVEDRACLSKWIPDENDNDPDSMRLNAVDENGNPL